MDEQYLAKLQDVGLTDKEARAYLALLSIGRGSAASVAEKSGLKTPTAYVILKNLLKKGFVRRTPRAKKQLFTAEAPVVALASVEQRVSEFRDIVPTLGALLKRSGNKKTRTLFFEGVTGMRKAYWYRIQDLKNIEYVAFFASAEDIKGELEELLIDWNKAMTKANVRSRALVPDHPTLSQWRRKDEEFKRRVKILSPKQYSSKNAIEIFPDFVRISMYRNLQCTIIEDEEFAKALRQIFELVWA